MDALEMLYLIVVPMILVMAAGSLVARLLAGGRSTPRRSPAAATVVAAPAPTLADLDVEIETPRQEGCCGSCGGVRH